MITIRKATPNDAEGIVEVQRATWITTYPNEKEGVTLEDIASRAEKFYAEKWRENIKKPLSHAWVAEDKGKIVGFCYAQKGDDRHHLRALYILESHQGKGIGKRLTSQALKWLGIEKDIFTRSVVYNNRAINFYKSFGFEEQGLEAEEDWFKFPSGNVMKGIILKKSFT